MASDASGSIAMSPSAAHLLGPSHGDSKDHGKGLSAGSVAAAVLGGLKESVVFLQE